MTNITSIMAVPAYVIANKDNENQTDLAPIIAGLKEMIDSIDGYQE